MLNRFSRLSNRLSRRQWALAGGVAGISLLITGVAAVSLVIGGSGEEELLTEACVSPAENGDECDPTPTRRTPRFSTSTRSSGSVTPTPTATPKPSPTKAVTLPTKKPAAPPVTSPPTPAIPSPDAYITVPLLSDTYLGSIGSVIEFAVMPGTPNTGIVASQNGKIYKVALDGSTPPQLWGDLSAKLTFGGEQGLLSVAFSPGFASNGRVYAYYTTGSPAPIILARYSANASALNAASETVLLSVPDFAPNHNGGHIAFDSAGYLYLSTGDGGGGDPEENGQDLTTLLGKVLRLNVSGNGAYTIPPGNPFNDGTGPIKEEIFAYGFRNPWRMTIDPQTDQVWLGDVGQNTWEEVDQVVIGGNYGWDCLEGSHVYEPDGCSGSGFRAPRHEYDHSFGQAVTCGAIYRGSAMPELKGWYVFGDFYSGHIWAVNASGSGGSVHLTAVPYAIASFTLLPNGELAIVSYDNGVYLLTN